MLSFRSLKMSEIECLPSATWRGEGFLVDKAHPFGRKRALLTHPSRGVAMWTYLGARQLDSRGGTS
jgi:hypothetical protein